MYNTYFSSTIVSLGSRGSLSSSSSDCPYLLNDRFQRNPLLGSSSSSSDCCCSCCSCCGSCTHRVPTNPSYLYGLRQSNLIQWSCSRRLFLGGGRRYFCRVPVNGIELDGGGYEVSCSVKKRSGGRGIGRRSGRVRVLEDESESYGLGGVEDVEAVISLLCEEIGKEGFGGRERRRRGSVTRVEVETRGNNGGESYIRRKKNVGSSSLESDSKFKIELVNGESREEGYSYRQGKERTALSRGERRQKNVGVTSLESDSKCRFESVNAASREEDYRQHREREALSKDESRRTRKEGSVSSYYSFSSSGDFESDVEAEAKHGELMEESSSGFQEELRKNKDSKFREEVKEERRVDDSEEHREESRWKNTTVGRSGVEWDWRKNSEKKLAQVSIEEDQSRKESSQMHSRVTRIKESDYGKAYSSQKQFDSEEENLTFVGSSKKGTNEQYSKSESRMKHQELTDRQGIHNSSVDKFSRSQNQVSGREEKGNAMMRTGEHLKAVGVIAGKYDSRTNSQQLTGLPERHSVTERTSNLRRESETRMKNWEETSTSVQISDRKTEERQRLIGERTTGQVDLRKESQQGFSMISETSDSKSKKTSILQSDSRLKSQVQNSRVASSSGLEAEEKHSRTDQGVIRRIQSQKGSQDVTSTSMVHAGDMVTVIGSGRSSEKRVTDQEAHLTSTVRRERHNQTDERVMQLESTREAAKRKVSSFRENISKEASSSGASLSLVSPARSQKIDAGEENQRSSSARMMPPSAQLVSRGSFHIELASGIASGQGTTELDFEPYGGAGRDETYRNPSNFITDKDALSSAYQSQKFSQEYVSDFVEQARHEIQTSETRKEKKVSETILVHGDDNRTQNSSIQDSSGDSQLKEHDSRRTSGGSGTKGPSDEMWHVTDPSIQEPSIVRDPEVTMPTDNTTENAIVRRSGRSMWNIIADIARLRWGSHTESPGSVGAKSSPNESVGTEGWFSGREHEECSDENAKKKRIKPQETTSSNEKQLGKSSSQSEGETSDTMRSKDKKRDTEAETSYPPSIVESGSAPISNSGEENLGSNEDRKSFPGTSSGMAIVESSLPLIARGSRRSPIIEEISETGKTDVSRHGSLELIEQPSNTRLTEGKDGELKRRKLKRENQLVRDCYDDWEDAYKHESEQQKIDEMFMREALAESKKAADAWEVPVGAVLVQNGTIIARGYNLVEELRDSTAHAEMICIREASNQLKTWRLADTTLYVTLEPCPMCAGAILQARIDTLVWGAPNKLLGADGSWVRLFPNGGSPSSSESGDKSSGPVHPFHPNMKIRRGVLSGECADAMQQFFQLRRKKKKGTESDLPNPSSTLAVRRHPSKFLSRMQQIFHVMFCL